MEGQDFDGASAVFNDDLPDIQVTTKKRTFDIDQVLDISESSRPHQPVRHKFPYRTYGIKIPLRRSFQPAWFTRWRWIHYDESRDLAFCHVCVRAVRRHGEALTSNGCGESTFISTGYCNWKEASIGTRGFSQHENSLFHLKCAESLLGRLVLPKTKNGKSENQRYLKVVAENVRFLARQGIPLQHDISSHSPDDNTKANGNFAQLMRLTDTCEGFGSSTLKTMDGYFTPSVQNELIGIMGLEVLHGVASDIRESKFFSLVIDEINESPDTPQVALYLRWVDHKLQAQQDFVGLYTVPDTGADSLVSVVRETLVHLNLDLADCRGVCYDGASATGGSATNERRNEVVGRLQVLEPRILLSHGHPLGWAVVEKWKRNRVLRDFLGVVYGIIGLVRFESHRRVVLRSNGDGWLLDQVDSRSLDPARWTPKLEFLEKLLDNYGALQSLWTNSDVLDADVHSRLVGVQQSMHTFPFLVALHLTEKILRITDNLSRMLQHSESCVSSGQTAISLTVATLHKMRTDDAFRCFWTQVITVQQHVDVDLPSLPRFASKPGDPVALQPPEDFYRRLFSEAIEWTVSEIQDRFAQPGYRMYGTLESLLLKAVTGDSCRDTELRTVLDFYGDDFDGANLRLHLELLETAFDGHEDKGAINRQQVETFLASMKGGQRCLFSEVCNLFRLVLVVAVDNPGVVSDAGRRVREYLRVTPVDRRVNRVMLLHVHRQRCDGVCLWRCLNTFVDGDDSRLGRFGKFKKHFCCLTNL